MTRVQFQQVGANALPLWSPTKILLFGAFLVFADVKHGYPALKSYDIFTINSPLFKLAEIAYK